MPTKKKSGGFTVSEAAKELGISRQAVHDAIKKGYIEAQKGKFVQVIEIKRTVRGWHIPATELEAYRKRLSVSHQERGKKT